MQLYNPITLRDKMINCLLSVREEHFDSQDDFIELNKASDLTIVQMLVDTAHELRFERNKAISELEDIQLTATL